MAPQTGEVPENEQTESAPQSKEHYIATLCTKIEHLRGQGVSAQRLRTKLEEAHVPEDIIDEVFTRLQRPALTISNLSKYFGTKRILHNVSCQLHKGEVLGIIGLSGSGKTTLLNILIGFIFPDTGSVHYRHNKGTITTEQSGALTRKVGFAPQRPSFYHTLSVWENLDYFGSLYYMDPQHRKERVFSLLKLVNLDGMGSILAGNLSGGMQRRLGIACALIHDPDVLLLDEPTADLDPILRKDIYHLIGRIHDEGKSIVITSHFLNEVETLCNKMAILHDQEFIAFGTPQEVKDHYTHDDEIHLCTASRSYESLIDSLQHTTVPISHLMVREGTLIAYTPQSEQALHTLLHLAEHQGEKVLDIDLKKPSLNEVFESLVTKKKYWSVS